MVNFRLTISVFGLGIPYLVPPQIYTLPRYAAPHCIVQICCRKAVMEARQSVHEYSIMEFYEKTRFAKLSRS